MFIMHINAQYMFFNSVLIFNMVSVTIKNGNKAHRSPQYFLRV